MPRKVLRKRKTVGELISSAVPHNRPIVEQLSADSRAYIVDVAKALRGRPEVSIYAVATKVKEELGLTFNRDAIVRVLKRLRDAT